MDVVPLTPTVVDCVTFDRAPLGRRGYNEDQVDDFLDRVQATLAGKDNLTAQDVRDVVFDPAAFIRRGYHEDQVDEFLDLVVEELDRRSGNPRQAPRTGVPVARTGSPTAPVPPFPTHMRQTPPPGATEQTAPMLFSLPPSMPAPSTQPMKREEQAAASGPPTSRSLRSEPSGTVSLPAPADSSAPSEPVVHTPPPLTPSESPAGAARPTNGKSAPALPPPSPDKPATEDKPVEEASTEVTAVAPQPSAPEQPAPPQPPTAGPSPATEPPDASATATASEPSPAEPASTPEDLTAPASSLPAASSTEETPQQSASSKAREFEPEAWRDSDLLALPLPPAPPGERGYRPGDVERLMKLLAAMLADPSSPGPDDFANLKLSRTFFVGQGYHTGAVDTLRQAWLDELTRRAL